MINLRSHSISMMSRIRKQVSLLSALHIAVNTNADNTFFVDECPKNASYCPKRIQVKWTKYMPVIEKKKANHRSNKKWVSSSKIYKSSSKKCSHRPKIQKICQNNASHNPKKVNTTKKMQVIKQKKKGKLSTKTIPVIDQKIKVM